MKTYDNKNKRLIVYKTEATPEYWDNYWKRESVRDYIQAGSEDKTIKKITSRYLETGSRVLEGGCGIGQYVYGLTQWGYDAYGVDFAQATVLKTKQAFPELKIEVQDVRKLDFHDNYFDGYWSLGVVEHFWDGYNTILREIQRVIKPGGYLFISFPHMSLLRTLKARLGMYKRNQDNADHGSFYQFILDYRRVRCDIERFGFKLIRVVRYGTIVGLKDEIRLFGQILEKLEQNNKFITIILKYFLEIIFSCVAGHSIICIYKKIKD